MRCIHYFSFDWRLAPLLIMTSLLFNWGFCLEIEDNQNALEAIIHDINLVEVELR